ncbi:MAG TPA: hypothetical protein VKA68_12390, partial [bacterium]|nr:hypothetical protein [bacterium]
MTTWKTIKLTLLALVVLSTTGAFTQTEISKESERTAIANTGALAGDRYRVVVSTDIGGTDPDDF